MKRLSYWILAALLLVSCLLSACKTEETAPESTEEPPTMALEDGTRTLGFYTDDPLMQTIPAVNGECFYGSLRMCNDSCKSVTYVGVSKEDYDGYRELLLKEGYTLFADNGETGIHEDVYYSAFQKEKLTIHLVFQKLIGQITIIAGEKEYLSPHLLQENSKAEDIKEGEKTTLLMVDLAGAGGMLYVFRLKTGHFLVWDGGERTADGENLLKHLKSMVPEGETPVIDAWFLTHGHSDHYGSIKAFTNRKEYAHQVIINGLYFNEANADWSGDGSYGLGTLYCGSLRLEAKNEEGGMPEIYRPVLGQRYYFADVTVEIVSSTDFIPYQNSRGDFNDTSTIAMVNVDGQTVLLPGDAEDADQYMMMGSFRADYFNIDIYQAPHHALAVLRRFVNYAPTIRTVLVPQRFTMDSYSDTGAVPILMEKCEEYITRKNGTIRVTFPYTVGEAEVLGHDFKTYPTWDQSKNHFIENLLLVPEDEE